MPHCDTLGAGERRETAPVDEEEPHGDEDHERRELRDRDAVDEECALPDAAPR